MKKIIALGASNSKQSINKIWAHYVSSLFENFEVELLDLNDYVLPLFGVDLENEIGLPENAVKFYNKIAEADLLVISLAEHNGTYTTAWKNLMDWTSRHDGKFFQGKNMLLLSTSTGGRGGLGALEAGKVRFPIHGAKLLGSKNFPKFEENFIAEKGIVNEELKQEIDVLVQSVAEQVK